MVGRFYTHHPQHSIQTAYGQVRPPTVRLGRLRSGYIKVVYIRGAGCAGGLGWSFVVGSGGGYKYFLSGYIPRAG